MTTAIEALHPQRLGELYAAILEVTGDPRAQAGLKFSSTTGGASIKVTYASQQTGEPREFHAEMTPEEALRCMGQDAAYVAWMTDMLDGLRETVALDATHEPAPTFVERAKVGFDNFVARLAKQRFDRLQ